MWLLLNNSLLRYTTMGKVTIKHYLNKSIKPRLDGATNTYPLYVQIIVNRTNYKMKSNFSFWDGYIKESDFDSDFIQRIIVKEKEQLENVITYLIDNNKTEFLNADSFKKLSAPLWTYLSENFWSIFVKEGEVIYDALLPSAFYNATFYDINDIINFTQSDVESNFSQKYKYLRIGMDSLQNAVFNSSLSKLKVLQITIFDFLFGEGKSTVSEIVHISYGFYSGNEINDEKEYNNVISAIEDFIFNKF